MTSRRRRLLPSGERSRLTALYGGLLVALCGTTVAVVYVLLQEGMRSSISRAVKDVQPAGTIVKGEEFQVSPAESKDLDVTQVVDLASKAALEQLLVTSVIVLVVFAVLSVFLAWWMAGRVLRPLAVITATARRLSGHSLHERIDLQAPPGELKQLADTFDDMLERIETLVSAQQRFTANAAHELRTPLTVQRAAAEIGLADPDPHQVQQIRRKLIDATDSSERLIEGLLLLSVTDQGLQHSEPVALHTSAETVVHALADEAHQHGVVLHTDLRPSTVTGETLLLEHLIRNLVVNAIRYNHPGGRVEVRVDSPEVVVSNTGPDVPAEVVPQLFEPFRRLQARRHAAGEGAGLGLSIVASIARAHSATPTATANPDGGLTVRVAFDDTAPKSNC